MLSTLACGWEQRERVRGTWLCATGWTPIAWSWIALVLNGPLAGCHRPRWPWHLAPAVCSVPWWSYSLTPPSPPPRPCIAAARGDARLRAQGALPQPRGHAAVRTAVHAAVVRCRRHDAAAAAMPPPPPPPARAVTAPPARHASTPPAAWAGVVRRAEGLRRTEGLWRAGGLKEGRGLRRVPPSWPGGWSNRWQSTASCRARAMPHGRSMSRGTSSMRSSSPRLAQKPSPSPSPLTKTDRHLHFCVGVRRSQQKNVL